MFYQKHVCEDTEKACHSVDKCNYYCQFNEENICRYRRVRTA